MRVGFITASLSRRAGGIYDATRFLAGGLQHIPDCDVAVCGLVDDDSPRDAAGWGDVHTSVVDVHGPRAFGYAAALAGEVDQWNPDLLHAHGLWMYPSVVSHAWSRRWHRPHVISPHGMLDPWAVNNSRWKKLLAALLYENAHLRGAACIHALCKPEAQAIRAYGLRNPICVIPNGVALPEESYVGQPVWASALPTGSKVLLYLGRIHPKKGLRELILGWHLASTQGGVSDEWHLVIAGWDQGGHEAELNALADELGISGYVHFVGPQFDVDKRLTYQAADAFILPSFSEGLPMVVLEAWAYGLPVLMTPACNLEVGYQAGAAFTISNDPVDMAKVLTDALRLDDGDLHGMGQNGMRLVEAEFSWKKIAEQMHDVYQWCVGGGAPPETVLLR